MALGGPAYFATVVFILAIPFLEFGDLQRSLAPHVGKACDTVARPIASENQVRST
jgi:hypothetical protein